MRLFLRAGATFHDGRPVTSDEVLPVLQRALKEARNTDYFGGFAYVESVEASDDRTIVLRLSRPDAFLLNELTNTTIVASDDPNVGTGPFRIVTRVPHLEFERYGRYYRGVPAIERVEIATYESQRSAWAAISESQSSETTSMSLLSKRTRSPSAFRTPSLIRAGKLKAIGRGAMRKHRALDIFRNINYNNK